MISVVRIPIVDIKKITKRKVLGIFNSAMEILTIDQNFNFCSFQDRDTAYDRIFALWKVSSPYAKTNWIEEDADNPFIESDNKPIKKSSIESPNDPKSQTQKLPRKQDLNIVKEGNNYIMTTQDQKNRKSLQRNPQQTVVHSQKLWHAQNLNGRKSMVEHDKNSIKSEDFLDKNQIVLEPNHILNTETRKDEALVDNKSDNLASLNKNQVVVENARRISHVKRTMSVKITDFQHSLGDERYFTDFQNEDDQFQNLERIEYSHHAQSFAIDHISQENGVQFDTGSQEKQIMVSSPSLDDQIIVQKEYTDEEMMAYLEKQMPPENTQYLFDLGVKVFPVTLDEFYDLFLKKDGPMSMQAYLNIKKFKDIVIEDVKTDTLPKKEGETQEQFIITLTLPVAGIPFIKATKLVKNFRLTRYGNQKIFVNMENRTPDVPYGDHFYQEERWTVLSPFEGSKKVILKCQNQTFFVKNTIFKTKIYSRSETDIKQYFVDLMKIYDQSGILSPEKLQEYRNQRKANMIQKAIDKNLDQNLESDEVNISPNKLNELNDIVPDLHVAELKEVRNELILVQDKLNSNNKQQAQLDLMNLQSGNQDLNNQKPIEMIHKIIEFKFEKILILLLLLIIVILSILVYLQYTEIKAIRTDLDILIQIMKNQNNAKVSGDINQTVQVTSQIINTDL
ncbi:UNKNOWN [Stylonychia lemnae]|uniref:VASt domain-containing protein n=1 Tax=Stylonychia lemnae TaxID=5949 RepID=A0A078AZ04_STYLE|nr:UNKNOWN [Stylonychia lemnae]|eukprot:CDW86422.1 UNKNOWN [Stylonychia lemnae]